MKPFSPMLMCNEQPDLDDINYPLLSSTKLDGCRLLAYKGQLVTRSLKQLQNKQLKSKFEPLALYSVEHNVIMDGEIYAEGIPFYMISSCFMTQDYTTKSAIKKWVKLCEDYEMDITREEVLNKLKFYMFDCVIDNNYNTPFTQRYNFYSLNPVFCATFKNLIKIVSQQIVNDADEVRSLFKSVLNRGYEGLILKDPNGRYKCGRTTLKGGLGYKCKPYVTLDAQIIGVKQATKVDPSAPKTINELGRSVTSKKKGDRIPIERATEFTVIYEKECDGIFGKMGKTKHEVDVGIGGTEAERDEIWANKESYIGRWIEYIGLKIGMKSVPRHCNMKRFREDKDE